MNKEDLSKRELLDYISWLENVVTEYFLASKQIVEHNEALKEDKEKLGCLAQDLYGEVVGTFTASHIEYETRLKEFGLLEEVEDEY